MSWFCLGGDRVGVAFVVVVRGCGVRVGVLMVVVGEEGNSRVAWAQRQDAKRKRPIALFMPRAGKGERKELRPPFEKCSVHVLGVDTERACASCAKAPWIEGNVSAAWGVSKSAP